MSAPDWAVATRDDVTSAWLSEMLGRSADVLDVTQVGTGQIGTCYRVRATGAGVPGSLLLLLQSQQQVLVHHPVPQVDLLLLVPRNPTPVADPAHPQQTAALRLLLLVVVVQVLLRQAHHHPADQPPLAVEQQQQQQQQLAGCACCP